jgi:hypothetical protein
MSGRARQQAIAVRAKLGLPVPGMLLALRCGWRKIKLVDTGFPSIPVRFCYDLA